MDHGVATVVSAYCRYIDAANVVGEGRSRPVATLAEWAGWGSTPAVLPFLRDGSWEVCDERGLGSVSVVGGFRGEGCVDGRSVSQAGGRLFDDGGDGSGGVGAVREVQADGSGVADFAEASPVVGLSAKVKGKNYARNKAKREKAKLRGSSVCPSLTSVKTVDTRTAEEIEASRTYALRRAAENKVAEAQAKFKLAAYSDPDRVKAHKRLEAMRYSQRINEANAKSQASYKKCDESLKSLGSSGSAGELLLKQQVKKAQEDARMLKYAETQLEYALQFASPAVHRHLAGMDPPQFESAHEIFGDPPDDFDADERAEYWAQLDQIDSEAAVRTARC